MRLVLTLVVLLAACLAGSYAVAPVPKERKKTTADKLVGKWKLVRLSSGATPGGDVTLEFKKDGKVTVSIVGSVREDTYKVKGDTIHFHSEHGPVKERSVTIKSLTHEELVTAGSNGHELLERIAHDGRK